MLVGCEKEQQECLYLYQHYLLMVYDNYLLVSFLAEVGGGWGLGGMLFLSDQPSYAYPYI